MLEARHITQLFMLFTQGDKQLISQLKHFCPGAIAHQQWQFSLGQLHQFVQHCYPIAESDYQSFRSTLFNSSINHDLAAAGWVIKILVNRKNVDRSIYVLQKLTS